MFDPKTLTGADISTEFCGVKLRSPYILSSGPLGYGAKGLIRAHQAGCGAVVTKTIRIGRAIRFRVSDLDAALDRMTINPIQPASEL